MKEQKNYSGWGVLAVSLLFLIQGLTCQLVQNWQGAQDDTVFNTVKLSVSERAKFTYSLPGSTKFP